MAARANVTPAQALARLMIAAFATIVLTLLLMVGMVGVSDPVDATGATPTAAVSGP